MAGRYQLDGVELRILSELQRLAAMPNVKNVRSFPVLGVAKDLPVPLENIGVATAAAG
jgi:hypothetical protein